MDWKILLRSVIMEICQKDEITENYSHERQEQKPT
jgi:hypothetical protein